MVKDPDGSWHPKNTDGSKHEHPKAAMSTGGGSTGGKTQRTTTQTRWQGVRVVKEIGYNEVNEHLVNGWVILDRVERMGFRVVNLNPPDSTSSNQTVQQITESVYVVGQR